MTNRAELLERAIRLKKTAARSRPPDLPPRPAAQPARLGEMQRSLWLVHQLDPRSPAYNLSSAFRVHGPLDVASLQRGFDEVVARHRILRSTFRADRDDVLQVVHRHKPLAIEVIQTEPGKGLAVAVREARRSFDLETGPLIRMRLIEEESGERLLLLVLHHILADERSLGFLWRELAEAYAGRLAEAEAPVQYDDYVHWLRDQGGSQEDLDYWQRRLDPLPEDLRLPFERPAAEGEARGRLLSRNLSEPVRKNVRRLATATGATPFMVFAFVFRLLLHRYTGGQRVAFAAPVSTRSHPATAKMIGYFLNPMVIATPIDEERAVEDAVRDFGRELRDLLAHASVPFQTLAEELSPRRQRDRHPIFQVMFVYQETSPPPQLGDARLEPVTLDLGESKFELTFFVTEGAFAGEPLAGEPLEVAVEYRTDRFDEVWMVGLLSHYEALLEHLPADLERPTSEVPMLPAQEESRLTAAARGAALDTAETALLPRQILDQARRSPRSPAVTCGGVRWSYGELESVARSIARELAARGVKPGDRVGLFFDRSALMVAALLGSHWAGAAYVPLDPGYPAARNGDVVADADVAAVLTTSALRVRLPAGSWTIMDVDGLDGGGPYSFPDLSPEAAAYILYTSGSTGRPKGVVITHGNLRASNEARLAAYDAVPKRFLLLPSIAFDSSVAGIFWTLATAGTLVIPTDDQARDPRQLVRLAAGERVTSLLCVPSLYAQLLNAGLQGLDTAIVAGESCPSQLVEEHFRLLPDARLFNEYGPTEATVWATVHEMTRQDAARPVAIGRPIPGVRLDVLDALGRRVPAGIPGNAWIAGPTVARGYWHRPELTAERFDGDRYPTGDRAAWTADGRLLFLGREDEQIKLRGFRIEPGEIEAALTEWPEVERAAVVARTGQLVAFVEGTHASWRQELAQRLPDFMVPSRLVELPGLPRLPNGKIDRRRLRDMTLEPEAVSEEGPLPSTREQTLLSLWEGLLGRSGIGVTDNFFELGGHSLLVVGMTSAIERDFEVTLAAADVFDNPTVRELARRIEQRGGSGAPPYRHLFPLQPGGRGMPFIIAVPHFFSATFAERFRGERPVYGLRGVSLRPEGNLGRWPTMTDLGEELVDEIQRRFPDESVIMAGYSFGASMAVEAVRVMEERGIPAHRLYLIAPMPVGFRPHSSIWRWLAVEPRRRLLCQVGRLRTLASLPLTPRILHADVRVERFRLHARYRPGPVHTPTVIFNAKEPETDAAATWRPYFRGPFTVHETPDPHLGEASTEAAREVILRHLSDLS